MKQPCLSLEISPEMPSNGVINVSIKMSESKCFYLVHISYKVHNIRGILPLSTPLDTNKNLLLMI